MTNRNLPVASIEIFHDRDAGRLDTGPILNGIQIVDAVTGGLSVVGDRRLIKVAQPDAEFVNPEKVKWPTFPADMNIVLTERPIYRSDFGMPQGEDRAQADGSTVEWQNIGGTTLPDHSLAIVSLHDPIAPEITTSHELGHLFGLKGKGNVDTERPGHCADGDCLMYFSAVRRIRTTTTYEPKRRLFRPPIQPPPKVEQVVETNNEFCGECSDDLTHRANWIAVQKL